MISKSVNNVYAMMKKDKHSCMTLKICKWRLKSILTKKSIMICSFMIVYAYQCVKKEECCVSSFRHEWSLELHMH